MGIQKYLKKINYKTVVNKNITLHGLAMTAKENKKFLMKSDNEILFAH